ncbi:MAG: DUF2147 domain-containing protein [Flavobacteriales bacterium]|nr:DUF2147 domain-containing protein [Flavobacteriales bacterium]
MMKHYVTLALGLFLVFGSYAQEGTVFRKWKTIDEETEEPKAVVDIYERDGKLYGKIIQLFREPHEEQDPICKKCSGEDAGKKVIGLEIIKALEPDDDAWEDGTILDAEHGKTYDCKLWLEDGILKVRGYVAFFYRTQEWLPYDG